MNNYYSNWIQIVNSYLSFIYINYFYQTTWQRPPGSNCVYLNVCLSVFGNKPEIPNSRHKKARMNGLNSLGEFLFK